MADKYYTVVTDYGLNEIMKAVQEETRVNITEIAVGDGGGGKCTPQTEAEALQNEVWRGAIHACYISEESKNLLIVESVIPYDVGGFTIREMAIFDDKGGMIAICNTPDTQKVKISDGVLHELELSMELELSNANSVQLTVDPNVVTATKKDIKEIREALKVQYQQLINHTDKETERASEKEAELEEKKLDKDGDASNTVINFLPAESLEPMQSGGEQKELFGQTAKAVEVLIAHLADKLNPHDTTKEQVGLGNVNNTSDMDKPVSIAQQAALDALYEQMTAYVLQKIADLINGASSSMDTLAEIEKAMTEHKSVVDALDAAIGRKANAAEFDSHVRDTTAHVTATERNYWNGKADSGHTHDYSPSGHTHDDRYYTEAEIDTKLNGKADSGHTHNYAAPGHTHDDRYYTEAEIDTKLNSKANSSHSHDYTEISGRPTFRLDGTTLYIDF